MTKQRIEGMSHQLEEPSQSAVGRVGGVPSHLFQRRVDESPRQVIQRKQLEQLRGKSMPPRTNGLPHPLRAGVEALSGMDMGAVVLHRNSAKPAQLNAHAYAQGNEIHLGPGQETYLPHEAWHVVQQRQGRVRPTTQLAGAAINDDAGLEREADVMGSKAMSLQSTLHKDEGADAVDRRSADVSPRTAEAIIEPSYQPAPPPMMQGQTSQYAKDLARRAPGPGAALQLARMHFPTLPENDVRVEAHKDAVEQIVSEVERKVDQSRGLALNWSVLGFDDKGYVGLWARTARDYFQNPTLVPSFIHARFGYAIETLACANLPSAHAGLTISFQVSKGHTRPDIVLRHSVGGEVGWLDITSADSQGHILGKDGAGWKNRPFIYEIFYEPLQLPEILTGLEDPVYSAWGTYLSEKNQASHEKEEEQRTLLRNELVALRDREGWVTGYGDASKKRKLTKEKLEELGVVSSPNALQSTKGTLAALDINDGPFGFNNGNVRSNGDAATNYFKSKAAPEIKEQYKVIDDNYMEFYQDIVADHQNLPLVGVLYDLLSGDDDHKLERATAVAATVSEYEMLREMETSARNRMDDMAIDIADEISELMSLIPRVADFHVLRKWSNQSIALRKRAEGILSDVG